MLSVSAVSAAGQGVKRNKLREIQPLANSSSGAVAHALYWHAVKRLARLQISGRRQAVQRLFE